MNNLRWRILLIVVIIGACLWAIIPPDKKIRLGLDLKGGVHLVLRVNTDDALRLETETDGRARCARTPRRRASPGSTVKVLDPQTFQVSGVPPAQDALFRQTAAGEHGELQPRRGRRGRPHLPDEAERRDRPRARRR